MAEHTPLTQDELSKMMADAKIAYTRYGEGLPKKLGGYVQRLVKEVAHLRANNNNTGCACTQVAGGDCKHNEGTGAHEHHETGQEKGHEETG